MKKISNVIEFVKARKEAKGDEGFSLIELVVAVGILAILSVTGVVAYSQITKNSRETAVKNAASEVYTAAVAYQADGNPKTDPAKVGEEYTASSDGITVTSAVAGENITVTATHTESNFQVVRNANGVAEGTAPVTAPAPAGS